MSANISTANLPLSGELQNTSSARILLLSCFLGAVMGVVFIIVQPMFGMDTLTSRHAAAYQQLGNWSATPAIAIAWIAHMAVSVFYGLLSGLVILKFPQLKFIALFALAFTWITTLIAPPANAAIVQLVSFQHLQFEKLPALNFSFDVKFVLHLLFFAVISAVLYIYNNKASRS